MEIEAKYTVPDGATFERLLNLTNLGEYELKTGGTQSVADHYYDTAGRALLDAGYALRLREAAGAPAWIATLKGLGGAEGAVHAREEYEAGVPPATLPDEWPDSPLRKLAVSLAGGGALAELVALGQQRHKRWALVGGRVVAEISLDEVTLAGPRGAEQTTELEIEMLADGMPEDLEALTAGLAEFALLPQPLSKFERALALAQKPRRPRKRRADRPKSPGVTADDTMAEAGRKVLRFHFDRMLANEAGTREGADPEALHDMRVASRRQRAAIQLLGQYFKPRALGELREGLRELAADLGAVRDLDVQLEAARAYQASLAPPAAARLEPLLAAWSVEREAARATLLAYLDGRVYARLQKRYNKFLEDDAVAATPKGWPAPPRVREALPGRLWEHYGAVRAFESLVAGATVETLHALRIEGKRLRYALEFFVEVLDPRIASAIKAVTALQDHLGALHDADVTLNRLHAFLGGQGEQRHAPETVMAVAQYLKVKQSELRRLQRTARRPWRAVAGPRLRRWLAMASAEL